MSNCEIRMKASKLLKNRYGEGFFAVMIFLRAYFILKIFDALQTLILLYNNSMNAGLLFSGTSGFDIALRLFLSFLTLAVMTPFITGGLWWFYQTASGGDNKSILKLYAGVKLNIRAFGLYLLMRIRIILYLIPSGICFASAVLIYKRTSLFEDQALILFISLQLFILGIFMLGLFLRCLTKIFLAPFIFIEYPDMNLFKIMRLSGKVIYGAKLECLKLIMTYFLPLIPLLTMPFILPRAIMSFSVFAKDRIGGYFKNADIHSKKRLHA